MLLGGPTINVMTGGTGWSKKLCCKEINQEALYISLFKSDTRVDKELLKLYYIRH